MRVVCIVGLPGSGKAYLANKILKNEPGAVIFNDISSLDDVVEILQQGRSCILTDSNLCNGFTQLQIESLVRETGDCKIEWYYFENNIDKAKANIRDRKDGSNLDATIQMLSKIYNPPTNTLTIRRPH